MSCIPGFLVTTGRNRFSGHLLSPWSPSEGIQECVWTNSLCPWDQVWAVLG